MITPLDEKIAILQDQVKKLQSQKDSLIKELDELEEKSGEKDRLYSKYFPLIIDMVAQEEDSSFSRACKELSDGLKNGISLTKMTYVFEQLKTAMIKEDIGPVSVKKKKSFFSSLKKSSADYFMDEFKQDYHDLVNSLRSCLDNSYSNALDRLAASIVDLSDSSDIHGIREQIFKLFFSYISDTNQDREKASLFVVEIADKILKIESKLIISHEQTDSMYKAGQGFESELQNEMGELKKSSSTATSLEELKSEITTRLASIDKALLRKQKNEKVIQMAARKNFDAFKSGFIKLKKELSQATRNSRELEKKMHQDQLTGSFNRRAYEKKIIEEMERFKRYGSVFSLLLIDADNFKSINDKYGHAIGDRCLKEIIKRALPLIRVNDMLARYGGEEFVVIMPETESEGAREAAEKIRKTIEKIEFLYKNEKVNVTVSIGISQVKTEDENHLQVFERADIAVYKAKDNGRNQVVVY